MTWGPGAKARTCQLEGWGDVGVAALRHSTWRGRPCDPSRCGVVVRLCHWREDEIVTHWMACVQALIDFENVLGLEPKNYLGGEALLLLVV